MRGQSLSKHHSTACEHTDSCQTQKHCLQLPPRMIWHTFVEYNKIVVVFNAMLNTKNLRQDGHTEQFLGDIKGFLG